MTDEQPTRLAALEARAKALEQRVAELTGLLRDTMHHPGLEPCGCDSPKCLINRIDAALAPGGSNDAR